MDNPIRCPLCKKCLFDVVNALSGNIRIKCPVCKSLIVMDIAPDHAPGAEKARTKIQKIEVYKPP